MAWRAPRYCLLHAARAAGAAAITSANAFATAEPKDHLIDDRAGSLARFSGSASDHDIRIDRGAGTLEAVDRVWIPSGHNVNGQTLTVESSTTGAWGGEETSRASFTAGTGAIDESVTSNTDRHIRLTIGGTGTWALGELVFTRTRTVSRGPEPGWEDEELSNTASLDLRSGAAAVLVQGVNRRRFRFSYRAVSSADDLTFFSDLVAAAASYPILVDPAFDDESAVWVRLPEDVSRKQDPLVPAATDAKRTSFEFELLENVA